MKKNFLTVAAMAAVTFFVSAEIAKAADVIIQRASSNPLGISRASLVVVAVSGGW